jgi:hypothetical protein
VVISDPAVTEDGLRYHLKTLQGALPAAAGPCVLRINGPLARRLQRCQSAPRPAQQRHEASRYVLSGWGDGTTVTRQG